MHEATANATGSSTIHAAEPALDQRRQTGEEALSRPETILTTGVLQGTLSSLRRAGSRRSAGKKQRRYTGAARRRGPAPQWLEGRRCRAARGAAAAAWIAERWMRRGLPIGSGKGRWARERALLHSGGRSRATAARGYRRPTEARKRTAERPASLHQRGGGVKGAAVAEIASAAPQEGSRRRRSKVERTTGEESPEQPQGHPAHARRSVLRADRCRKSEPNKPPYAQRTRGEA